MEFVYLKTRIFHSAVSKISIKSLEGFFISPWKKAIALNHKRRKKKSQEKQTQLDLWLLRYMAFWDVQTEKHTSSLHRF